MNEHTPGPWRVDTISGVIVFDQNKSFGLEVSVQIPMERFGGLKKAQANASRIVACFNACEGIEDPQIAISKLCYERDKARQERDQAEAENAWLREALEKIAKYHWITHNPEYCPTIARAALGKEQAEHE